MSITQFPHGISSFGVPVFGSRGNVIAGNVFFVCSVISPDSGASWAAGVDSTSSGDKATPYATINYAISQCTANNGDVIYVLPGHSETISAAAGIAANKANISIIGIGNATKRPIVTWATSTAATFTVTAANVLIDNFQFQNAIDSLVTGFSISAAGCQITNCSFTSPTSTNDALIWVTTTAAGDDFLFQGNDVRGNHAGPTEALSLVGADRAKIIGNYITGSYSNANINSLTTACLEILISSNVLTNTVTDAKVINMVASSTGRIGYNSGTVTSTAGITDANIIAAANCQLAQNYFSDAVGETGKLIGVVSA